MCMSVCPRSGIYIASYYIEWVTTSWINSTSVCVFCQSVSVPLNLFISDIFPCKMKYSRTSKRFSNKVPKKWPHKILPSRIIVPPPLDPVPWLDTVTGVRTPIFQSIPNKFRVGTRKFYLDFKKLLWNKLIKSKLRI